MNDLVTLDSVDAERLLYAIDTSLKVYRRHQFFLWVQGGLQSILPHDTLVCAFGDLSGGRYKIEAFSSQEVDRGFIDDIGHPTEGLLSKLINEWQRLGCTPAIIQTSAAAGAAHPSLMPELHRHDVSCIAGHGAYDFSGTEGAYFAFLRVPEPVSPRLRYMLEVFVPYLRMALIRVVESEAGNDAGLLTSPKALLSSREIEVLQLLHEGRTNHEIGQRLDISPLTVKNHVQKILRKLNANNRTAAAAKAKEYRLVDLGTTESA
ncbi:XrtB/PEP-CTERM-associated transcriptional regulator EpsA [Dechloromonas sp. HYN0024]|uniref:XrtB/PEP-CTERM-associated transcriptional regulator EpsA n=1 Tax=Dechloromonas sp. HYN0024 TaxID=2231055 RepID=UPI0013C36310|nr:XrtB/PEP-CTERM-associated transcriptional regulator EpsA [Dechloromonas sp. HYN0024]